MKTTKYHTLYDQQKRLLEALQSIKREKMTEDMEKQLSLKEKEARALLDEVKLILRDLN